MEQVYWLSPPTEPGTDTRLLLYRYGNFVYAGSVLTEPVRGLEYLPGVLTGIQAVQGQVPYLCEVRDLPTDGPYTASLLALQRAMDLVHSQLDVLTEKLGDLAGKAGNEWVDSEGAALYFEIETVPGYTCNSSEVIFAKSYRGEVMITLIWYAPHNAFYVTLTPSSGEEQTLVDTLFPQIYGKRRGITLHAYATSPPRYNPRLDTAYRRSVKGRVGDRPNGEGEGGKEGEEDGGEVFEGEEEDVATLPPRAQVSDPSLVFTRISVWEGSGEVPDPDAIKARDEEEEALKEAGGGGGGGEGKEGEGKEESPTPSGLVDVSGGEGYTQVYLVMAPSPTALRTPVPLGEDVGGGTAFLVPRPVVFRFGSWVYGGEVSFPVENLHLRDVPYVLPALQKQQGRLGYISDATAMPASHPHTPTLTQFMAAVGVLKAEMEDCEEEVSALASQAENSWIDEEGAASFFELSFRVPSIQGGPGDAATPSSGLGGAEVIASKVYLTGNGGMVLHVVWFRSSLFCVLADNTDDLPLLDVAFPDVTARNRVVQVKDYAQRTAEKLSDAFPGSPLPKSLRVWEGRRKGVVFPSAAEEGKADEGGSKKSSTPTTSPSSTVIQPAVGGGAATSSAPGATTTTTTTTTTTVTPSTAPTSSTPTSSSSSAPSSAAAKPAAAAASVVAVAPTPSSEGKAVEDDDHDLYDMGGVKEGMASTAIKAGGAAPSQSASAPTSAPTTTSSAAVAAAAKPAVNNSQVVSGGASRAPHFVAPLSGGGKKEESGTGVEGSGLARLIMVGGTKGEDAAAPWDATGKPRQ